LVNYSATLQILFGPQEIEGYQELDPEWAQALIVELAGMADYVVLDLPSSPSRANEVAVRCCHRIALVTECEMSCVMFSRATVQLLEKWRAGETLDGKSAPAPAIANHAAIARTDRVEGIGAVVVNRAALPSPPKPPQIRDLLKCNVIGVIPPAPEALRWAQNSHVLFVLGNHDHPCAAAMAELAGNLAGDEIVPVASELKQLGPSPADACLSGVAAQG
jgi:MinD-like ATPase involved in chromosome partitioning or flagellar assembly